MRHCVKNFAQRAVLIDNRYISANIPRIRQIDCLFAITVGEMYPVGLCLHILPGVLWHGYSRFLAEPGV